MCLCHPHFGHFTHALFLMVIISILLISHTCKMLCKNLVEYKKGSPVPILLNPTINTTALLKAHHHLLLLFLFLPLLLAFLPLDWLTHLSNPPLLFIFPLFLCVCLCFVIRLSIRIIIIMSGLYTHNFSPVRASPHVRTTPDVDRYLFSISVSISFYLLCLCFKVLIDFFLVFLFLVVNIWQSCSRSTKSLNLSCKSFLSVADFWIKVLLLSSYIISISLILFISSWSWCYIC